MDELRMQTNESRMDKGGAFFASLLFHALLLLVLASSSSFDLRLGEQSRFDVIFWLSPSSVAPQGEPMHPLHPDAPESARTGAETVKAAAATTRPAIKPAAATTAPVAKPASPATVSSPRSVPKAPLSPPPANTAKTEPSADATLLLAPAANLPPAAAAVKEERVEPAAKVTVHRAEAERKQPSALSMPVRLGAFLEAFSGGNEAGAGNGPSAAAAAGKARSEAVPAAAGKSSATGKSSAAAEESSNVARSAARIVSPGAVAQREETPAAKNERPAVEKHPEPRGIMTASLQGDLKMIISGDSGIRLLVTFREYPKSRRNRPLTRMEARREQRIQPLIAKTDENTREAVVETARDGIYIFIAEPENGERGEANFTLKLFERGGKERTAEIGAKSMSQKAVLARVLMRDGILWDDDSAFTGSMEDSESTTKFNANTGLYWKEYHH